MKLKNIYSPELRVRAVRLVLEQQGVHDAQWPANVSEWMKIGYAPEPYASTLEKPSGTYVDVTGQRAANLSDSVHWSGRTAPLLG